jgi:hypothetical protein
VRVLSDGKMKDHEVLQKKIYLFIIYHLLFIIYYLLFIFYYVLSIIYYLLSIIHHLLSIIYHLFNIIIGAADGDDAKPARGDGEGGGR